MANVLKFQLMPESSMRTCCDPNESNFQMFTIWLFFIAQWSVKSWIIVKPLEFPSLTNNKDIYHLLWVNISQNSKIKKFRLILQHPLTKTYFFPCDMNIKFKETNINI